MRVSEESSNPSLDQRTAKLDEDELTAWQFEALAPSGGYGCDRDSLAYQRQPLIHSKKSRVEITLDEACFSCYRTYTIGHRMVHVDKVLFSLIHGGQDSICFLGKR